MKPLSDADLSIRRACAVLMAMQDNDREQLIALLADLQKALHDNDEGAFRQLWDPDSSPDLGGFADNGNKLRGEGWQLQADAVAYVGERAELRFLILDDAGDEIDQAVLHLVRSTEDWRIASF